MTGFGANVPVSATGVIARSLSNELKDAFNDGCISDKSVLDRVVCVSAEGEYLRHGLEVETLRLSLAEDEREKPRRCFDAQRLLRGVQSSSEKSLVLGQR